MSKSPPWKSISQEIKGEIMKTDIYCEIVCSEQEEAIARQYITEALRFFREFEARYSRFRKDNELWQLNENTEGKLAPELFSILEIAQRFHQKTNGLFDPSILGALEHAGYTGVYTERQRGGVSSSRFTDLELDKKNLSFQKPLDLKIDLGGVGKGFIVDQVAHFFRGYFAHFLIDAGGDMFVHGENRVSNYPYWAIDVEDPTQRDLSIATLLLRDRAIATSGNNRRAWKKNNQTKHHLIDPHTHQPATSPFQTVTVLAESTVEADIWAKALFLSGQARALAIAEKERLPAIFVTYDHEVIRNTLIEPYVWQDA